MDLYKITNFSEHILYPETLCAQWDKSNFQKVHILYYHYLYYFQIHTCHGEEHTKRNIVFVIKKFFSGGLYQSYYASFLFVFKPV